MKVAMNLAWKLAMKLATILRRRHVLTPKGARVR
jgi:hypothetical protein